MKFCSPGILKVRLPPLLCTVPGVAPSKLSVMIPGLCSSALCCYLGIINISSCAEYLRVTTVCIKSAHKPHHYAKTSKSKMYWAIATWPLAAKAAKMKLQVGHYKCRQDWHAWGWGCAGSAEICVLLLASLGYRTWMRSQRSLFECTFTGWVTQDVLSGLGFVATP